jgi:hypothetical protein
VHEINRRLEQERVLNDRAQSPEQSAPFLGGRVRIQMLDGPSDVVTSTTQVNAARTGYAARTRLAFQSTSASGGKSAVRDERRDVCGCQA